MDYEEKPTEGGRVASAPKSRCGHGLRSCTTEDQEATWPQLADGGHPGTRTTRAHGHGH